MKKIIIKILIIFMFLVIIDRTFHFFFKTKVFDIIMSGETGGSLNYLIKYKKNTDFIILGTSRAVKQINPAILFDGRLEGYNAGIHGIGEIIYNDILFDIALNKGVKPKILILQIDLLWFFNKKINNSELIALYPFINDSKRLQHYIQINIYEEKIKLWFKSYQFNGKILNVIKNYIDKGQSSNNDGFDPSPCTISDSINTILTWKNSKMNDEGQIIDITRMSALENIILNCKKYNIKLIIVQPPSYENVFYFPSNNEKLINNIRKKYQVPCIDFSHLKNNSILNDPWLWKDAYHLNEKGANIFSHMLNDSIKNLNISY